MYESPVKSISRDSPHVELSLFFFTEDLKFLDDFDHFLPRPQNFSVLLINP